MGRKLHAEFGSYLKEIRRQRGLTQDQLSQKSRLDRTYVSMLERGVRKPSLQTVIDIADALEVNPALVVEEINNKLLIK